MKNALVSDVDGDPVVLVSNVAYADFRAAGFEKGEKIYPEETIHEGAGRARFNLWRYVDFNGDGALDIVVGPDDWGDYGWDDAFNRRGEWTRGPLHGSTPQTAYAVGEPCSPLAGKVIRSIRSAEYRAARSLTRLKRNCETCSAFAASSRARVFTGFSRPCSM
mgnify:CR=1 FL=1